MFLGIDLGGTRIRSCVLASMSDTWREVGSDARDTPARPEAVVAAIAASARESLARAGVARSAVAGAACAAPGPLDPRSGVIHLTPNLPGFREFPLGARLGDALGLPVMVDRDTVFAAIGERLAGAARETRDFVYLTVSTGLGGAIVSGGSVLRGVSGTAGELGHWPVMLPSARDVARCGCGALGCAEAYAGGRNLALRAGQPDAASAYAAAQAGDQRARAAIADSEEALAALAVGIVNVLNPEKIVVGGSIAEHEVVHVLTPMREGIAARAFAVPAGAAMIVPAALGADVGPVGAALAAREIARGRGEWFSASRA